MRAWECRAWIPHRLRNTARFVEMTVIDHLRNTSVQESAEYDTEAFLSS